MAGAEFAGAEVAGAEEAESLRKAYRVLGNNGAEVASWNAIMVVRMGEPLHLVLALPAVARRGCGGMAVVKRRRTPAVSSAGMATPAPGKCALPPAPPLQSRWRRGSGAGLGNEI